MNISFIDKIYLILISFFMVFYIYFSIVPIDNNKFRKYYHKRLGIDYDKYDIKETLRREKIFFNVLQNHLTIFFILSIFLRDWYVKIILGKWIARIGIMSFCVLSIILSMWTGPVKK